MKVLVTGATGLVGANVASALVSAGHDVRILVRKTKPDLLSRYNLEIVQGDICDPASLVSAVDGCEGVIHAAAGVFVGETRADWLRAVNVEGTDHLCRAAKEAGVARFVHVSSVDAMGSAEDGTIADEDTPVTSRTAGYPYATTKREAEDVVRSWVDRGLSAPIVNPAYMFGPLDIKPSSGTMILEIARGVGVLAPPGGNDFVDVRDVANGILAAFDRGVPGRRYILGGECWSYREAWTRIARIVGARPPIATAPVPLVRGIGRLASLYGRIAGAEPAVNRVTSEASCGFHWFSSKRAEAELGYVHGDVERGIADAWADFRRRGLAA